LPKTNWNNFTHLTISDFGQHPADTTLQVVLKSLKFTDSIKEKASYSVIFALLVFALICFLHPKLKRDKNLTNPKPNKYSEEEANLLLEYIDKNLSNPLLSLDLINKETGMNNFVVNEILKDKKNTHYKNYVDSLRIAKAKQMLLETEHQISVIAEQVGYCYSNSFSRIFGKYEKMTPNEYRTFSRSKSSPK
jgi:YesN/AraC family two-component response regulator